MAKLSVKPIVGWSRIRVKFQTRPDTRLLQSHAGEQGPYLRSVKHLGRSSMAKDSIIAEKVKCDGWMDGLTDKAGCRVA